jgi:hypothetical protein
VVCVCGSAGDDGRGSDDDGARSELGVCLQYDDDGRGWERERGGWWG